MVTLVLLVLSPNSCMEAFLTAHDEDAKPLTAITVPCEAYCNTSQPSEVS